METKVYKMDGTESGSVSLSEKVFASKVHPQTITDVVKAQLNNERQGNASTKNRALVTGSGRKLYRQKGTGRARQGDIKSPLHVGGGRVFGPTPRDYDHRPPKKVVKKALMGVLTDKVAQGAFKVIEDLQFNEGKTRQAAEFLKQHKLEKVLFILPELSEQTQRAISNLKNVKAVTPRHVNVVDLLRYSHVAISDKAVETLQEVFEK